MKLKIKDMDIATGGPMVVVINKRDAMKLDLHHLDRIKISKNRKIETVVVDIAQSSKAVPEGKLGAYEEVLESLHLKSGDDVRIMLARKPLSLEFIKKKLDGGRLNKKEIKQLLESISERRLCD